MKYLFCVDAESDGLYGNIFAIGAVVVNAFTGISVAEFSGRIADIDENVTDEWVTTNIVPLVRDLPVFSGGRSDYQSLRKAFWKFWMEWKDKCLCISDFGAPVEAFLFRMCVSDSQQKRMWNGPYPLHELGTGLLLAGIDPDIDRLELCKLEGLKKHNPLDDAKMIAECWRIVTGKFEP